MYNKKGNSSEGELSGSKVHSKGKTGKNILFHVLVEIRNTVGRQSQNKQKVVKMIPVLGNSFIQDIEYFYFNQHNTVPPPSHPFLDESCRHR